MKQRIPNGSVLTANDEENNPRILSEMGNKPNSRTHEVDQEPGADQQWTQYTQSET